MHRRQSYFSTHMCPFNCQRKNKKLIYANVYRNTINDGDSQTSPLPIFPDGVETSVHRLLRVYWRIFVKIFVSATKFCRRSMLQKIKSVRICMWDLLRRQSSSSSVVETKISRNSPVHTKRFVAGMCRPNRVAATSRPSCTHGARGLSPRLVAVSCRLVCFDLYSIITIQLHKKRNTKRSKYCVVKSSQKAKGL